MYLKVFIACGLEILLTLLIKENFQLKIFMELILSIWDWIQLIIGLVFSQD
jgi:hypothetical protein